MKRMIVVAGMKCTIKAAKLIRRKGKTVLMITTTALVLMLATSNASADIADREHDDANINTVLESVQATQDQIDGLIKLVETLQATCGEYQAPTVFRECRTVRGIKKCSRRTIEAVK